MIPPSPNGTASWPSPPWSSGCPHRHVSSWGTLPTSTRSAPGSTWVPPHHRRTFRARRGSPAITGVRSGRAVTDPPENGVDELSRLRTQIQDLDKALTAVRAGDVDAVVLGGLQGPQVYSLVSADRPYRVIVEEMGDGAVTVSERGIILYANLRLSDLVGADRSALLGRDVTELVDASGADALSSLLATTAPGTTQQAELELVRETGSAVPVLASVTGLDIEGVIVRCLVLADLTDRRRGEEELASAYAELSRSAHELEEAQRIGRIGSWFWNAATDEITCSTQIFRILGIDPTSTGTMLRTTLAARFHPEDAALATTARARALAEGRTFGVGQRGVHRDGG